MQNSPMTCHTHTHTPHTHAHTHTFIFCISTPLLNALLDRRHEGEAITTVSAELLRQLAAHAHHTRQTTPQPGVAQRGGRE